MRLRDCFWLWGHPEGRYNGEFGNDGVSRMTPMEGCLYLGVRNTFMIPDGWEINRRQYNKAFTTLNGVAWECFNAFQDPASVEPLIQEAQDFPNINGVVFDDFQRGGVEHYTKLPPQNLWDVRNRLHHNDVRRLNMWMVLYTHEFGLSPDDSKASAYNDDTFQPYIAPFDGIIMWTWREKNYREIPEKFEIFKKLTEGKHRMAGCYLWDFGDKKPASGEAVKWQLDWWRERLLSGELDGIVLHTNTMADLDLEAYDVAVAWMQEHGDEILPE